jgi:hypothetical protein
MDVERQPLCKNPITYANTTPESSEIFALTGLKAQERRLIEQQMTMSSSSQRSSRVEQCRIQTICRFWLKHSSSSIRSLELMTSFPGDLFRWPLEILGGENPKRDGGNDELAAPIEYLIELARSEAVNRMRIGEAESLPIPSVAVEDDADMRRHRTAAYLPKQSAFVEVVEDFLH